MEFARFRVIRLPRGDELRFTPEPQPQNADAGIAYVIGRGSLRETEEEDGDHYVADFMVGDDPGLARITIIFGEGVENAIAFNISTPGRVNDDRNDHRLAATITPEAKAAFLRYAPVRPPPPIRPRPARAPANPVNLDPAALPKVKIPRGQESMISFAEIPDGAVMVDFHNERDQFHRYFTREVFDQLPRRISPATNRPIAPGDITYYVAELDETMQAHPVNGGRRRKGRKGRKTYRKRRFHTRRA